MKWFGTVRGNSRLTVVIGVAITAVLFVLNIARGVELHQVDTLYDPVYRMRQTLVVALSRLRGDAPGRYLGDQSVLNLFVSAGFAILEKEMPERTLLGLGPDMALMWGLERNGVVVDALLHEAVTIDIDPSQPPVLIRGSELGWVDFFYLSFKIFGLHVASLFYLYYLLLGISTILFCIAFARSPPALFVLAMFWIGHYLTAGYIAGLGSDVLSVTNSRFFSAPAVLPALHVLLAIGRRDLPSPLSLCLVTAQALLLLFYVFCRVEAIWLPLMLLGCFAFVLPYRELYGWALSAFRTKRPLLWLRAWPIVVVLTASVIYAGYYRYAPAREYRSESRIHVVWHALYTQTIGVLAYFHEKEMAPFLNGQPPFSDNSGYLAALATLRARNDVTSPIASVRDGVIYIDVMQDMGAYDRLIRALYFQFIRKHPYLALEALYDNIRFQRIKLEAIYTNHPDAFAGYGLALGLGLAVALLYIGLLLPQVELKGMMLFSGGAVILGAAALVPVMTVASPLLFGSFLVFAALSIMIFTALPVAIMRLLSPILREIIDQRPG